MILSQSLTVVPNVDQNISVNVLAGGVTYFPDTTTDTLSFAAGTGVTITGDAQVIKLQLQTCTQMLIKTYSNQVSAVMTTQQSRQTVIPTTLNFVSGGGVIHLE